MLSAEQYQHLLTVMEDLAEETVLARIEAKHLAEQSPYCGDAQVLADRLKIIRRLAYGLVQVLRDEGEPT